MSAVSVSEIQVEQGASLVFSITVKDRTTGLPLNVVGATLRSAFKRSYTDTRIAGEILITPADQILTPSKFNFSLTPAQTKLMGPGILVWDAYMTRTDGTVIKIAFGTFNVIPGIAL